MGGEPSWQRGACVAMATAPAWLVSLLVGILIGVAPKLGAAEPALPTIKLGGGPFFALSDDGFVWGSITLQREYDTNRPSPVIVKAIPPLENVVAIGAGVAVDRNRQLWVWNGRESRARVVRELNNVLAAARSSFYALAAKHDGTVWSWHPAFTPQSATEEQPADLVRVQGIEDAMEVDAGARFGLAVTRSGTVWMWNEMAPGEKGGTVVRREPPARVPNLPPIKAVAAGDEHALALAADGTVWAWGANMRGQLGDGTTENHADPVQVHQLREVIATAAGARHSVALRRDGTVWAWGMNDVGQLGASPGIDRWEPVQIEGINQVIAITAGGLVTMAVQRDGTVWSTASRSAVPGLRLVRQADGAAAAGRPTPSPNGAASASPAEPARAMHGELTQGIGTHEALEAVKK
jgi:hypothetical protein